MLLLTNDDGIGSPFLRILAETFAASHDCVVVAPAHEQSWIGKKLNRYGRIAVDRVEGWPCETWKVDSTPSDCVNIALHHLLPRKPSLVVSGPNIGYNLTLPLLFCSGTVGAALEGVCWGIPALATSQRLPLELFDSIKDVDPAVDSEVRRNLRFSAGHALRLANELLAGNPPKWTLWNINFPWPITPETEVVDAFPDHAHLGGMFAKQSDGHYAFEFKEWDEEALPGSDREVTFGGRISRCVLRYDGLCGNRT